jgi:hypothetical protein
LKLLFKQKISACNRMRDEWFLAAVCFLASAEFAFGDDRLDNKEINPRKLEESFSEGDEIESDEDQPIHERGRKQMDLSKVAKYYFLLLLQLSIFSVNVCAIHNMIRNF